MRRVVLAWVLGSGLIGGCFGGGGGALPQEDDGSACPPGADCPASAGPSSVGAPPAAGAPGDSTTGVAPTDMPPAPGEPLPVAGAPVPGEPAPQPTAGTGGMMSDVPPAPVGGSPGFDDPACFEASYLSSNGACRECFCQSCVPVAECDDACWSLGLCIADNCLNAGDTACIIERCIDHIAGATSASNALIPCDTVCPGVCGLEPAPPPPPEPVAGNPEACNACIGEWCPGQLSACLGDVTCTSEYECGLGCGLSTSNLTCILTCGGSALSLDLISCSSSNCTAECTY